MKKSLLHFIGASLLCACAPQSQAVLSITPGDLVMGFFKMNSAGTGVESNTYVVDLGSASLYRESFTSIGLGNISADLATAFGPNWSTDSAIRWGIVGATTASGAVNNGDPARTIYLSRDWNGTLQGSPSVTFSSTELASVVTAINTFGTGMNGAVANGAVNPAGAIVGVSAPSDFTEFVPPSSPSYFNGQINPLNNLGSVLEGLDVYRALFSVTASGVDLTSAASTGNAALRTQQYIGTFNLSSTGELNFVTPVPEPASVGLVGLAAGLLFRRRRSASSPL